MNYKTPGDAIFGLNAERERVFFKDARVIENNRELIELFKIRHTIFFIDQVQVLEDNKAAFPLVHMTLYGIKALAKVLNGKKAVGQNEVCEVLEQMNPVFTKPTDASKFVKFVEFWDDRGWGIKSNTSDIFYILTQPDLKFGYVLDYGEDVTLEVWEDTFFRLNPGWLWNSYKSFFNPCFDNLTEEQEQNIADYIRTEILL